MGKGSDRTKAGKGGGGTGTQGERVRPYFWCPCGGWTWESTGQTRCRYCGKEFRQKYMYTYSTTAASGRQQLRGVAGGQGGSGRGKGADGPQPAPKAKAKAQDKKAATPAPWARPALRGDSAQAAAASEEVAALSSSLGSVSEVYPDGHPTIVDVKRRLAAARAAAWAQKPPLQRVQSLEAQHSRAIDKLANLFKEMAGLEETIAKAQERHEEVQKTILDVQDNVQELETALDEAKLQAAHSAPAAAPTSGPPARTTGTWLVQALATTLAHHGDRVDEQTKGGLDSMLQQMYTYFQALETQPPPQSAAPESAAPDGLAGSTPTPTGEAAPGTPQAAAAAVPVPADSRQAQEAKDNTEEPLFQEDADMDAEEGPWTQAGRSRQLDLVAKRCSETTVKALAQRFAPAAKGRKAGGAGAVRNAFAALAADLPTDAESKAPAQGGPEVSLETLRPGQGL